MNYMNEELS